MTLQTSLQLEDDSTSVYPLSGYFLTHHGNSYDYIHAFWASVIHYIGGQVWRSVLICIACWQAWHVQRLYGKARQETVRQWHFLLFANFHMIIVIVQYSLTSWSIMQLKSARSPDLWLQCLLPPLPPPNPPPKYSCHDANRPVLISMLNIWPHYDQTLWTPDWCLEKGSTTQTQRFVTVSQQFLTLWLSTCFLAMAEAMMEKAPRILQNTQCRLRLYQPMGTTTHGQGQYLVSYPGHLWEKWEWDQYSTQSISIRWYLLLY